MKTFKKVEIQNHFQENIGSVLITCDDVKFKITSTRFGNGLMITKVADNMEDNIMISPKATNQIRII